MFFLAAMSVTLISSDLQHFQVPLEVAAQSTTIKNMVEEIGSDEAVPVPNVSGAILARVIEYCTFHASSPADDARKDFDAGFVKVEHGTLFGLILAANYLHIKPLLDLMCVAVADKIRGKTTEQIRETFGIKNDFTPEEEDRVRAENQWAFD